MVTCRKVAEFLLEYLEGSLPANQRDSFQRHLRACRACEVYLKTYEHTIRIAREAMCDQPDTLPPVPEDLIKAILLARAVDQQNSTVDPAASRDTSQH